MGRPGGVRSTTWDGFIGGRDMDLQTNRQDKATYRHSPVRITEYNKIENRVSPSTALQLSLVTSAPNRQSITGPLQLMPSYVDNDNIDFSIHGSNRIVVGIDMEIGIGSKAT